MKYLVQGSADYINTSLAVWPPRRRIMLKAHLRVSSSAFSLVM